MPESKKVSGILWGSVKNEFIFHLKQIIYYALSLLNAKDLYWVLVQSFLIRQQFSIQKGYNRSKIEKEIITIIFSILKWDWITNFRLNRQFWFFEQDFPKKVLPHQFDPWFSALSSVDWSSNSSRRNDEKLLPCTSLSASLSVPLAVFFLFFPLSY